MHGGQDYRLWAWKGDYLNLGAGAELGIYSRLVVNGYKTDQWLVDQALSMHMTLQLLLNGEPIINWDPAKDSNYEWDKVWWVTGFNPYYTKVDAANLTAIFTVTFNTFEMYDAFYMKYGNPESNYYEPKWTGWDPKKYTATFTF